MNRGIGKSGNRGLRFSVSPFLPIFVSSLFITTSFSCLRRIFPQKCQLFFGGGFLEISSCRKSPASCCNGQSCREMPLLPGVCPSFLLFLLSLKWNHKNGRAHVW